MPTVSPINTIAGMDIKANYYLSNNSYFDKQFLAKIIHEDNIPEIYYKKQKIINKLFDHSNFPTIGYSLSEMGPKEIFRDFKNLPYKNDYNEDMNAFIMNLGISYMVGLARGHTYNEGVFEMPSNIENHRTMVICFRYKDRQIREDTRLYNGYLQIAIFIPRDVLQYLPSFSSLEDQIMDLVKSLVYNDEYISEEKISSIKYNVLDIISDSVIQYLKTNSSNLM